MSRIKTRTYCLIVRRDNGFIHIRHQDNGKTLYNKQSLKRSTSLAGMKVPEKSLLAFGPRYRDIICVRIFSMIFLIKLTDSSHLHIFMVLCIMQKFHFLVSNGRPINRCPRNQTRIYCVVVRHVNHFTNIRRQDNGRTLYNKQSLKVRHLQR